MLKANFVLTVNTLAPNLKALEPAIEAGVGLAFDAMQPVAESFMRENAPWHDRTGNARGGLRAQHVPGKSSHSLILFHTMPYGIFLEVRWSGRYAIIAPSVKQLGPDLMKRVTASVDRAIRLVS